MGAAKVLTTAPVSIQFGRRLPDGREEWLELPNAVVTGFQESLPDEFGVVDARIDALLGVKTEWSAKVEFDFPLPDDGVLIDVTTHPRWVIEAIHLARGNVIEDRRMADGTMFVYLTPSGDVKALKPVGDTGQLLRRARARCGARDTVLRGLAQWIEYAGTVVFFPDDSRLPLPPDATDLMRAAHRMRHDHAYKYRGDMPSLVLITENQRRRLERNATPLSLMEQFTHRGEMGSLLGIPMEVAAPRKTARDFGQGVIDLRPLG